MPHILIGLTSHAKMGATDADTGFHLEEFTTPYYAFKDAGFDVDLASVQGGEPPIDPSSETFDGEPPASVRRFYEDEALRKELRHTMAFHEVNASRYDGIYLPGGHGTMWDFPDSAALSDILVELWDAGKTISAICHGPAGFVNARRQQDNHHILKGVKVNCFTDAEEREVGKDEVVPFLLESKLREVGAEIHKGGNWEGFVVTDGQFVTGQNPNAAEKLGQEVVRLVKQQTEKQAAA